MAAFNCYARTSLCMVLLGGLAAGCSTYATREVPVPEVIPAQVCGGDADSDLDGVINCNDRCPDTLRGEAVDQEGCPLPYLEPKPFRG